MFKRLSLPVQLCIIIGLVLCFGHHVSETVARFLYTFSLIFKEVLGFLIPFMIFAFVLTGILSFKKNAPYILAILIGCIFISNAVVVMVSYGVSWLMLSCVTSSMSTQGLVVAKVLEPLVTISLPPLIASEKMLIISIVLGLLLSCVRMPALEHALYQLKNGIEKGFSYFFIPLLPLYVLGFLIKIQYEGVFLGSFQHYGKAFFLIISLHSIYLLWLYYVAAGFSLLRAFKAMRNALPSYLTAFSTMSSTATIPVTINAAEKNIHNRSLAQISMPIMANVHLLGDSINTPILAMVTMMLFFGSMPTIGQYAVFSFYFCTTMFAVSGIPGGGIIMMIPILISQLSFTPDMISIITAIYLLFDPFGTAANVMGDGALVIIVHKVLKKLRLV